MVSNHNLLKKNRFMKKYLFTIAVLGVVLSGCHNGDVKFDDFEYQTMYFAKQSPVRTITLGDDGDYDTSDDNAHRCYIKATLGGVNVNTACHSAAFTIDNSLCDNLVFASTGAPVKAMPSNYYEIIGDEMLITPGEVIGGVRVELTDAFFNDPEAVGLSYVIPVRLTSSADSILSGTPKDGIVNPNRLVADHWAIQPKDYTLYAIQYKNRYHGCWLSKGEDVSENRGQSTTNTRNPEFWEKATLRYLSTRSLSTSVYSFSFTVPSVNALGEKSEKNISCDLLLNIDDNGTCTVTTQTAGCTASGSGKWTHKGEPKAWGDKDRDLLELKYNFTISYVYNDMTGETATYKYSSDERMVMRDRQNHLEEFSFTVK